MQDVKLTSIDRAGPALRHPTFMTGSPTAQLLYVKMGFDKASCLSEPKGCLTRCVWTVTLLRAAS